MSKKKHLTVKIDHFRNICCLEDDVGNNWIIFLCFLQERVDVCSTQADLFCEQEHFDAPTIGAKKAALMERYEKLKVGWETKNRAEIADPSYFNYNVCALEITHDIDDRRTWKTVCPICNIARQARRGGQGGQIAPGPRTLRGLRL